MAQDNTPRKSGILPVPEYGVRADFTGTLIAPYMKFAVDRLHYTSVSYGGTFAGHIWGCPWNCHLCWSRSGHRDEPYRLKCTPELVVEKFIKGMQRYLVAGARITDGDVGYWWEHVRAVIDEFLTRTGGKTLKFSDGPAFQAEMRRRGGVNQRMRLIIETSGGITITPEQLQDIERAHGEHAAGIVLSIGMKATNPQLLADLTGMPIKAATAAFERQLALLRAACQLEHFHQPIVSFLDPYAPEGELAALVAEMEELRPGMARSMTSHPLRNYNWMTRR